MFYPLASILFPTVACETGKHSTFRYTYVCVSNASDTEFRLSIALGNEMDLSSLKLLISK